ncbi:MAG: cytochrome c biogenesis protein CcdA [Nocardioidaceae bacterium]
MNTGLLALALLAGGVAAFNPCGFALLPAYLSLLVSDGSPAGADRPGRDPAGAAVLRALRFTSGMTIGFVLVFGTFGVVVTPLALSVERYLPYLTIVIGAALLLLGGWLLAGRTFTVPGLAGRGAGPAASWWSQVGYGVSFALASLSCTIGPFLAVTSTTLRGSSVPQVVGSYVAYALGMGTVVLVLALAAAMAQASLVHRVRGASALIGRLSGAMLVVAGAYVTWYGWFEIRVLAGSTTNDVVIDNALRFQSFLSRSVTDAGSGALLATLIGLGAVIAVTLAIRRRSQAGRKGPAAALPDEKRATGPARSIDG